jgi:threonine/homoserine/homoserine lactone efflux protein
VNAELFLRGLAIGFAIAFALGPIGLLVIRRTIDHGWSYGFVSGVGVATADSTYAAIAALGLTAVTELLVGADRVLGVVGGAVLVALSLRALRSATPAEAGDGHATPAEPAAGSVRPVAADGRLGGPLLRPAAAWGSMVALTLTNPATILSFAALFASLGAGSAGAGGAVSVVAGVFAGSVAWWVLLTGLVARLRARLTPRAVRWLNLGSALVIGGFGVVAIVLGIRG